MYLGTYYLSTIFFLFRPLVLLFGFMEDFNLDSYFITSPPPTTEQGWISLLVPDLITIKLTQFLPVSLQQFDRYRITRSFSLLPQKNDLSDGKYPSVPLRMYVPNNLLSLEVVYIPRTTDVEAADFARHLHTPIISNCKFYLFVWSGESSGDLFSTDLWINICTYPFLTGIVTVVTTCCTPMIPMIETSKLKSQQQVQHIFVFF